VDPWPLEFRILDRRLDLRKEIGEQPLVNFTEILRIVFRIFYVLTVNVYNSLSERN